MATTNTNKSNTANSNPTVLNSFDGKVLMTLPYKGQNTLQGYEHPSILILEDCRVLLPTLKIEDGQITLRKFVLLGRLLPTLENGTGLFLSPTDIARQLQINLDAIASRLKDYKLTGDGVVVNTAQTANKALVISINL